MASAQPLEKGAVLIDRISRIAYAGGNFLSPTSLEFRAMFSEATEIQKTDVLGASELKAMLYALAGDADETDRWLRNLEANGGKVHAIRARPHVYMLTGRIQMAYDMMDEAFRNRGDMPLHQFLSNCMANGWFAKVEEYRAIARSQNLVFKGFNGLELAPRAAKVFADQQISIETHNGIIAEAHRVMIADRALWFGNFPIISIYDEGSEAARVVLRYTLRRTVAQVAELSWQLTDALVRKDLDVPGLIVSFATVPAVEPVDAMFAEA